MKNNIILYDGCCNLCKSWARLLKRWDKKQVFRFISIHSEEGQEMISNYHFPANTVIYYTGRKAYFKSTAILEILKDLGGWWRLFYILKLIPRPLRNWIYEIISKYRTRIFGAGKPCISV